jgi:hypothetical protein
MLAAILAAGRYPHAEGSSIHLYVRLGLLNRLLEIPRNLRADPSSHGDGNAIADHSISVVVTPRESETVRHSLQPRILPNRIRPHATLKPLVRNQSRTQVFGVVRNACRRDVSARRIADNRSISFAV